MEKTELERVFRKRCLGQRLNKQEFTTYMQALRKLPDTERRAIVRKLVDEIRANTEHVLREANINPEDYDPSKQRGNA